MYCLDRHKIRDAENSCQSVLTVPYSTHIIGETCQKRGRVRSAEDGRGYRGSGKVASETWHVGKETVEGVLQIVWGVDILGRMPV